MSILHILVLIVILIAVMWVLDGWMGLLKALLTISITALVFAFLLILVHS